MNGDRLGSTVASTSAPAGSLPAAASGGRVFTLRLQDPNLPRDSSRLRLPVPRGTRTGVFPVEIELRDPESGDRVSDFVTHLVAVAPATDGAPLGEPLNVSWIWPITADPATTPDGKVRPGFLRAIGADGRLSLLAGAASRSGDVPLTLVPGPETLETWAQRAKTDPVANAGVLALRAAARTQQVLSGPYVAIDMPSLERAGLGEEASLELNQGAVVLGSVLGKRLDSRTTNEAPLDPSTLARLQLGGVDRAVVSPGELVPPAPVPQFTPSRPFTLQNGGKQLAAYQTDEGLTALLIGKSPPALRAAHFLAGLAVVAIEQPNQTRGLVVEMPPHWNPESTLLDAVLAGLDNNPLLAPATLDELFDRVPLEQQRRSAPVVRELAPVSPAAPTVNPAHFRSTRDHLSAYKTTVPANDPLAVVGRSGPADLSDLGVAGSGGPPGLDRAPELHRRRDQGLLEPDRDTTERADGHPDVAPGGPPAQLQQPDRQARPGPDPLREREARVPHRLHARGGDLHPGRLRVHLRPAAAQHHDPVPGRDARFGDLPAPDDRDLRGRQAHPWLRPLHRALDRRERCRHLPHDRGGSLPRHLVDHPLAEKPASAHQACDARHVTERSTGGAEHRLVRSSAVVGLGTALSRITGLLRVSALAALGLGRLTDVYNIANSTPNIVYELLLGGILTATLVPLYVEHYERKDDRATDAINSVAIASLAVISVLGFLAAPWIIDLYTLRLHGAGKVAQQALATDLLRWFMPQIFFYGLTALATAMLNARRRFAAAAFAPVLNNIVVIAALLALPVIATEPPTVTSVLQDPKLVVLLGLGTTAGIIAMALVLLPALRHAGARLHWVWEWRHPAVRHLARLSGWTIGYVATNQVAFWVALFLAYGTRGDASVYLAAFTFFQLPHGLFAVSIMTALAPELASPRVAG